MPNTVSGLDVLTPTPDATVTGAAPASTAVAAGALPMPSNSTPAPTTLNSSDPALLAQLNALAGQGTAVRGQGYMTDTGDYIRTGENTLNKLAGAKTVQDWLNTASTTDQYGNGVFASGGLHSLVEDLLHQNMTSGADYEAIDRALNPEIYSDPNALYSHNALHGISNGAKDPSNVFAYNSIADYGNALMQALHSQPDAPARFDASTPSQLGTADWMQTYLHDNPSPYKGQGVSDAEYMQSVVPPGFQNWQQVYNQITKPAFNSYEDYQASLNRTPEQQAQDVIKEFYRPKASWETTLAHLQSQLPPAPSGGPTLNMNNTPTYDHSLHVYPGHSGTEQYNSINPNGAFAYALNPQDLVNQNNISSFIFQDPNVTTQQKLDLVTGKATATPIFEPDPRMPGVKNYVGAKIDAAGSTTGLNEASSRLDPNYQYLVDKNLVGTKINNQNPLVDVSKYSDPKSTQNLVNIINQDHNSNNQNLLTAASYLQKNDVKGFNNFVKSKNLRYGATDLLKTLGIKPTLENFAKYRSLGFNFA